MMTAFQRKSAVPAATGNGGTKSENPSKIFRSGYYTAFDRSAIARLPAKVTAREHFIIQPVAGGRWCLMVSTWTGGRVELYDTEAEANRARLKLSDEEIPGFLFGGAIR